LQLVSSVNWIEGLAAQRLGHEMTKAPRLLAPLAALLRSRDARMQINSSSASSILDSVVTRIDEARDITRYIVNLLIFLGLLGTFYGLATTVPAVVETIRSLAPNEGDSSIEVFGRLMGGLEKQLGGMGTAFGSSLLGLTGSLVVGLLELFAGHGQNRFYRELEEWLSTITRLGFSSGDADSGGDHGQASLVLNQMGEQMESMQAMFTQTDVSRSMLDEKLGQLAGAVERMTEANAVQAADPAAAEALLRVAKAQEQLLTVQQAVGPATAQAMARAAEGQEQLLAALVSEREEGGPHVDAESRMRLRSIDVQLLRILEEMSAGRQESIADLRGELARLTQAIEALGSRTPPALGPRRRGS
ncbi:MAG: hypothetical protein ACC631_09765, partial [Halocynthiibacter sp.]